MTNADGGTASPGAAMATLGFSAFVLGTAEFVIVGVLDLVAGDLRVSIATAGHLVMAYALGITVGGPVAAALTVGAQRKLALVATLLVFAAVNLVMGLSSDIYLLLAARFASGALHGLFVGVGAIAASELVPPERRGRAMSMVFGGIALATVLGVPVGTYLAQLAGWRVCFLTVAALALLGLCAMLLFVPPGKQGRGGGLSAQMKCVFVLPVLAMLGVGVLLIGGQFGAYTYMAPYLKGVTGASAESIGLYLLLYGAAGAGGMFMGGKFADRDPIRTLSVGNVLLLPALASLYWFGTIPAVTAVLLAAWGFISFALVPSLTLRVVRLAGCGADLAATLSASALNVGIAGTSLTGGWALTHYGLDSVVLLALGLSIVALPATFASRNLRRNQQGSS
jgi:MFS transporter, DHA1 family, inner membrane transport protein